MAEMCTALGRRNLAMPERLVRERLLAHTGTSGTEGTVMRDR